MSHDPAELCHFLLGKDVWRLAELAERFLDDVVQRLRRMRIPRHLGIGMRFPYDGGKVADDGWIEFACLREAVQGLVLVETAQMNRPFDGFAGTAELKTPFRPRYRNDALVQLRRQSMIYGEFTLAKMLPLLKSRIIKKRQFDCALDLVGVFTGKKNH